MKDLTIIYITANRISEKFANSVITQLLLAVRDTPIISVSHKPIKLGQNIVVNAMPHHLQIYANAYLGAKEAKTKYIAIAEDDTLYSPEHFKYRPSTGKFAYNISCWGVFTWSKPAIYSHKLLGRRNHNMLICERDLYVEAMRERFNKYPYWDNVRLGLWAEPGKYENQLGVTVRETETFFTNPPNVMFSHPKGLSHAGLGERKRLGELRAYDIPYWNHAKDIIKLYTG